MGVDNFSQVVHIHTMMSKELDMSAVENCVCFNLRWVTRAVTQFYDAETGTGSRSPSPGLHQRFRYGSPFLEISPGRVGAILLVSRSADPQTWPDCRRGSHSRRQYRRCGGRCSTRH